MRVAASDSDNVSVRPRGLPWCYTHPISSRWQGLYCAAILVTVCGCFGHSLLGPDVGFMVFQPAEPRPAVAGLLGAVPAFGTGHFYAGDRRTGFLLLAGETLGVYMFLVDAFDDEVGSEIGLLGWSGAGLFFGSWFYDICHAPVVARRQGRESSAYLTPRGAGLVMRF